MKIALKPVDFLTKLQAKISWLQSVAQRNILAI